MEQFPAGASRAQNPVPFSRRWEDLRPVIERLYIVENCKLKDLIEIMKTQHNFDSNEAQYKHQFKKWDLRKYVPSSKKDKIVQRYQVRAQSGKASVITYKNQNVDERKLVRQVKRITKKDIAFQRPAASSQAAGFQVHGLSVFSDRIFLQWNRPFGVFMRQQGGSPRSPNHPSPFAVTASTPLSQVSMHTPPETADSPANAPPALSAALRRKATIEKTHLFVQGKHHELQQLLSTQEKRVMSTWLYQFWLYSFTTAKYWGQGPRIWNANNLGFEGVDKPFDVGSPSDMHSPRSVFQYSSSVIQSPGAESSQHAQSRHFGPSQLCRWSVHVYQDDYEDVPEPEEMPEADAGHRIIDEEWPTAWKTPSFEERMRDNLETNDFSSIKASDLPIAMPDLAKAAKQSESELLEEALGFAIMGRNLDLVIDLADKARRLKLDVSGLYPQHLAASYLDGSRYCCQIFGFLLGGFYRKDQRNGLGHTLLDTLMMTILKSHTSIDPGTVDDSMRNDLRFPGDEVDICGRWDAGSECYRNHLCSGSPRVPFSWKHKFCHTSIQAVVHCIFLLSHFTAYFSEPSGLFLKRCVHCGAKLQLFPLHALVLTAFHLGKSGCPGEDLFGAVACLLAMIAAGHVASDTAELSLPALFHVDSEDRCNHERLSPAQFARRIPANLFGNWAPERMIGWRLFCRILQLIDRAHRNRQEIYHLDESDEDVDMLHEGADEDADWDTESEPILPCDFHVKFGEEQINFGQNQQLKHLWASIQTELLNYRRLQEGDPWLSDRLNMEQILFELENARTLSTPLVQNGMMQEYCQCGRFRSRFLDSPFQVNREETSAFYFSNMDDWSRTTVLDDRRAFGEY